MAAKKRDYPMGVRLSVALGKDTGRFGNGTPTGTVVLELVEKRDDGRIYICGDSKYDDPHDTYYNWLSAEERHYLLDWKDSARRRAYDDLGYNSRMGCSPRIEAKEAMLMAKTLAKIEKGILKAQDKTGLSLSYFDGYLRNLMMVLKPSFVVYKGADAAEQEMDATSLMLAYTWADAEIQKHFNTFFTERLSAEALVAAA